MATPDLTGKRILILGAEYELGRAIATAVAEAGADLALVAATPEADAAFAVQRLARRLTVGGGRVTANALGATNEAAVRVMVRQVSKELGGLDALVFCAWQQNAETLDPAVRFGGQEAAKSGFGLILAVDVPPNVKIPAPPTGAFVMSTRTSAHKSRSKAQQVVLMLDAMPNSR